MTKMTPGMYCLYQMAKHGPLSFKQLLFNYHFGDGIDDELNLKRALDNLIWLKRVEKLPTDNYCLASDEWPSIRETGYVFYYKESQRVY